MRKKGISFLLAVMLIFSLQIPVFAAENPDYTNDVDKMSLVSVYGLENELYAFINPNGRNTDGVNATLQVNGAYVDENKPSALTNEDTLVRYLFLIDLSGSMSGVTQQVGQVIRNILETDTCNAVVTVATFGEKFQVVMENGVDVTTILQTVNNLKYKENWTNPYDGLLQAYDYLETQPRKQGEQVNLVLITDGTPAIRANENETIHDKMSELSDRIKEVSSVVLHTVGVGNWDSEAYDIVSKGTGKDVSTVDTSAKKCGQTIAEFVNQFQVVTYNISQFESLKTLDMSLRIIDSANPTLIQQLEWKEIEIIGSTYVPDDGEQNPSVVGTESEENTEDSENTESTDSTDDTENAESTENTEEDTEDTEMTEKQEDADKKLPPVVFFIGGVAVALLIVGAVVLVSKKTGNKISSSAIEVPTIQMQLVVLSGNCSNKKDILQMKGELFVGSSKKCAIVLNDENVSSQHARVYFEDGIIYIEDLQSQTGTYIDGMRIYTANRLRNGNVITVGESSFRLDVLI